MADPVPSTSTTARGDGAPDSCIFVLVHGAWAGGWCWRRVAARLMRAGHTVFAPTLTGVADRSHLLSPAVNLATHVADIVNLIRWEDLTGVVLVGHSYGGMVISRVAEEVPEAIDTIVFLDAFVPEDGSSMLDYLPEAMRADMRSAAARSASQSVPPLPAAILGVNERDRAWVDAKLTPQPFATFTDKAKLTGACERVPKKAYIRASGFDLPAFQAAYEASLAKRTWRASILPVGHVPMIDVPDELAQALLQAA